MSKNHLPHAVTAPQQQSAHETLELLVGNSFVPAHGEVELALYNYQIEERKSKVDSGLDIKSVHELSHDTQSGILQIMVALTEMGVDNNVLYKRLQRIGYVYADSDVLYAHSENELTEGFYDFLTATAVTSASQTGNVGKHTVLHETLHGLLQSQSIFQHDGKIKITGNGITVARAHNGDSLDSLVPDLNRINEASIEMVALLGSGLTWDEHLASSGYAEDTQALHNASQRDPRAVYDIIQAGFVTGINSAQHAQELIDKAELPHL